MDSGREGPLGGGEWVAVGGGRGGKVRQVVGKEDDDNLKERKCCKTDETDEAMA